MGHVSAKTVFEVLLRQTQTGPLQHEKGFKSGSPSFATVYFGVAAGHFQIDYHFGQS